MNTIKWELEDLSFATLYPKVYDEIVRLVAERAPAREEYLAGVREQVSADLRAAKIKATVTGRPKHYYSVYQKMIVRGRDFEEIYDLVAVRVLVDSVRDCYAALGRAARAVEPGARAVQGLHRDAEVQHVPVAAHDGHRPRGQAGRDPDPHPHDAPPGRVRRRRALEVQGGRQPAPAPRRRYATARPSPSTTWPGCASCSTGRRRPPTRGSSSTRCASRSTPARSTSSRPRAQVVALPAGVHPGRLRLRRAHRGRPPLHRRPGQRPARAAREHARERRRRRGAHLQGRRRRPVARLADLRQEPRGRATRSGSGSPRSAARRRSRPARTRSPRRCASRACRCSGSCRTSR